MFVGKCLLYEVQCVKQEHSTQIQCVCCSELWLLLVICSFCFFALLMFYCLKSNAKLANIAGKIEQNQQINAIRIEI